MGIGMARVRPGPLARGANGGMMRWGLWRGVLALGLAAAPALAAPRAPLATLYSEPGFHGHWVKVAQPTPDLGGRGIAWPARSGRFDGAWTLCEARDFGGPCRTLGGEVADLGPGPPPVSLLPGASASARAGPDAAAPATGAAPEAAQAEDDGYFDRGAAAPSPAAGPAAPSPGGSPGADQAAGETPPVLAEGVAGYASVFFIRPQRSGADIPGGGRALADAFCRGQGLGPALHFDSDGHILRDVLCKRD